MKQYEIWWARLELPAGPRPVLLLSRDAAYRYLTSFLACEITSRARHIPQEVVLGPREGVAPGSVASMDNLRTVPKDALEQRLGRVAARRIVEIKAALGHALGWPELVPI